MTTPEQRDGAAMDAVVNSANEAPSDRVILARVRRGPPRSTP
jgi:hypothetical protein